MSIIQITVKMLILSFLALWAVSCSSSVKDEKIPVTTESESARLLFDKTNAYFHLAFFQQIIEDYQGQVVTLLKNAEIKEDPANVYNSLGNTYMAGEMDSTWTGSLRKARIARTKISSTKAE
jgi:hypothetical protein